MLDLRPYATVADIKEGDLIEVDGDFTCIEKRQKRKILKDAKGYLYFECNQGYHGLNGQLNDADEYVGVYHAR